jgi:hypothetical protein
MVITIGGHSRNAGKTSVACALIRAMTEARWTAVKISGHGHGAGSAYELTMEPDADGSHDSSRYLRAGAVRAFLLRYQRGRLGEAMPALRDVLGTSENVMIESSSILEFIDPDLYLFVRNDSAGEFKESARSNASKADAIIAVNDTVCDEPFCFRVTEPEYMSPELVEFVRSRLSRRKCD